MLRHLRYLCCSLALLSLACSRPRTAPREPAATVTAPSAPGLPRGVGHSVSSHGDAEWDVFELDLAQVQLRLYGQADPALRRFAAVRRRLENGGERWGPLTNAGLFHAGERPVGLFIEAGATYTPLELADGQGNFYLKPNGVFYVDAGGPHVIQSERYAPPGPVALATQSGPLLVEHGALHPRFVENSIHRATRSGIGVRDAGHAVIALSRSPVTFHATATLFRDVLGCPDALYLDGSISDYDVPGRSEASTQAYGGILAVVAR